MCMTSSLSNCEIVRVLESFLKGKYSLSEVEKKLHNHLVINFGLAPARREILKSDLDDTVRIPVDETHVCHMLERYVSGRISELELSNWAALVFLLPVFIPKGETEEERWEAGNEMMWDVIQRLATPESFEGLNTRIARRYLRELCS
jgi:hypothetical protein